MATLRDIKRRITSVKSTQQITKAMKMVAAAKLRRAQERLLDARPYAEGLKTVLAHVAAQEASTLHPLLAVREPKHICYLVVTSDRGLCGSFNANINRRAKAEVDGCNEATSVKIINFGRKGFEFFGRRGYEIHEKFINLFNELDFNHAVQVSSLIQKRYRAKEFDRVYAVYNRFKTAGTQILTVEQLLPIEPEMPEAGKYEPVGFLYEPSATEILETIIPKNLNIQIWRMLLESYAAEQGARMVAMDSATENAHEMIYQLTLSYNKARQAAITKEILEIVGGAEALQG
ncbi:MAG: ATP synthase F1 subunit gamma [bacterium]